MKSGSLNLLEPSGLSRVVKGLLYLYIYVYLYLLYGAVGREAAKFRLFKMYHKFTFIQL